MNQSDGLAFYWKRVSENICRFCAEGDGKGNCGVSPDRGCALRSYFPEVVRTMLAVPSDGIDEIVSGVRDNVCNRCEHTIEGGACFLRMQLDCGLDRHLPLVAETVREAHRARRGL